ncbi:Uncharacterised protein [Mycolicibacterium phlei]|nr:Uncharacterised protein [Mycolicibacterium phlei]
MGPPGVATSLSARGVTDRGVDARVSDRMDADPRLTLDRGGADRRVERQRNVECDDDTLVGARACSSSTGRTVSTRVRTGADIGERRGGRVGSSNTPIGSCRSHQVSTGPFLATKQGMTCMNARAARGSKPSAPTKKCGSISPSATAVVGFFRGSAPGLSEPGLPIRCRSDAGNVRGDQRSALQTGSSSEACRHSDR